MTPRLTDAERAELRRLLTRNLKRFLRWRPITSTM